MLICMVIWKTNLESSQTSHPAGFSAEVHRRQYAQLLTYSMLEQSAIYHVPSFLLHELLSLMAVMHG